jgi:hypothetical protein
MGHLELVALVVREYEPAIDFFVNRLVCLPETQPACLFAHSPWDLNVRRAVNSLCRGRTLMSPRAKVENGDEIGDGVLARQQHGAWQSVWAVVLAEPAAATGVQAARRS